MKKIQMKYLAFSLAIFITALFILNFGCGGNDSSGVIPDVSGTAGQSQTLITKDVSGFVYANSSLSSKDGEDEETVFSILDIPINGEEGFIAQVNEYIQSDSSSRGSSPETEELLNAFTEETSQYQPLPVWNSAANIYSSYADALSTSPIPISPEGEISGSVLVNTADDLVSLDIEVSGGECYETETISSSDLMNSSESSGDYLLRSCPNKIIIKPGDCKLFQVFSKPSVNLFDAGLQFSIANPEFGTVCGPIYLRCNGAKKYSVAYGVIYAKKNVETPLDTVINVSTTQGQNLSIPVQIVKKTAVVSGKVYAGGPIVKGYVISQGPKSQCKINEDGTYSLPKVWQGTGRKITATWWVMEGNKKMRYRETKFVNVFGDMTVNFGMVVEPTPTPRDPWSPLYDIHISHVIYQYNQWEAEIGTEAAVQKTISWLNGTLPDLPVPGMIIGAETDELDNTAIWIDFEDGHSVLLGGHSDSNDWEMGNYPIPDDDVDIKPSSFDKLITQEAETVDSNKILILAPYVWEEEMLGLGGIDTKRVYTKIGKDFESFKDSLGNPVYDVTRKTTSLIDINFMDLYYYDPNAIDKDPDILLQFPDYDPTKPENQMVRRCICNDSGQITPENYYGHGEYGIVYIATHGSKNTLSCGLLYDNDNEGDGKTKDWMKANKEYNRDNKDGLWFIHYQAVRNEDTGNYFHVKRLSLTKNFLKKQNFSNAIVYIDACFSYILYFNGDGFTGAKVFLGHDKKNYSGWSRFVAYKFFTYMMYGTGSPSNPTPMSVGQARDKLYDMGLNPDPTPYDGTPWELAYKWCHLMLGAENYDVYFPAFVNIIVHKDK